MIGQAARYLGRYVGTAALVAQILVCYGCSSSGGSTETGTGGTTGGTGTGGTTGGNPSDYTPLGAACPSGVKNKGACTVGTDADCFNTCGPNKTGIKNCTCSGGMWSCPTCGFDPANDYSCYKLSNPLLACPPDDTDPSGMGLPQSGSTCTQDDCMPCGNASGNAYRDSSGSPKVGYCICVHSVSTDGTPQAKYSCASVNEYPPQ